MDSARGTGDLTVDVAAHPDYVWAVLVDVARWPEWTTAVRAVVPLDGGPLSVGGGVRVEAPRLPVRTWRVDALSVRGPRRGFTWTCHGVGSVARLRVTVSPGEPTPADTAGTAGFAGPAGTRVRWELARSGRAAAALRALTGATSSAHLEALADGLRRRCEQRARAGRA